MSPSEITSLRLQNLQVTQHIFQTPVELLRHMGAMQAQDYQNALWAIGVRLPALSREDVERAIEERQILRTWPMRGTIHFVPAEDAKWMVQLMAPRILSGQSARRRQLELTEELVTEYATIIIAALKGGEILTRKELLQILNEHSIVTAGQRGIHILWELSQRGILCFGPYKGKQPTFVLLDEWVPNSRSLSHEAAVREMALRYFTSHGPATIKDFCNWTRLTIKDAKQALESLGGELACVEIAGNEYWLAKSYVVPEATSSPDVHLLPGFEEYMLGYRDRSAMLELAHANKVVPGGNGVFFPIIVVNGQIKGVWKRSITAKKVGVTLMPFSKLSATELAAAKDAALQYGAFVGLPTEVNIA
jgi:hypothetical protein